MFLRYKHIFVCAVIIFFWDTEYQMHTGIWDYYTHVHDSRSLSFPSVPLPPLPPIRVMLGYVHEKLGFCCPLSISADFRVSQQTESDPSDHWLIPPNFSVTAETVSKMRPDPTNKVKWFISSQWTRECLRPSFMQGVQSEIITYLKGIKHTKTFIWYAKTNQTLIFLLHIYTPVNIIFFPENFFFWDIKFRVKAPIHRKLLWLMNNDSFV